MDVARKSIATLNQNAGAAAQFAIPGASALQIQNIAINNPAYVALGAIGPDIFFLLPDFKKPWGARIWGAMNHVRDLYMWLDDNFIGPFEDTMGSVAGALDEEVNALSGGVVESLAQVSSATFALLRESTFVLATRSYDFFGVLGSGPQAGYDEQVFFWSDMLHYRRTSEFPAYLWAHAGDADPSGEADPDYFAQADARRAFALGWMSHVAADITGHCFVNEKCGGPFRLHWQRHHVVENHMDAHVYRSEFGLQTQYQDLTCSALHLWIAFNTDHTSRQNFFFTQPGPSYLTGTDAASVLDRKAQWDVDSELPDHLAKYLAAALRAVYPPDIFAGNPNGVGQCAGHPTIMSAIDDTSDGYPSAHQIAVTYWWLFKYTKLTTTDFFKLQPPPAPVTVPAVATISPPGTGASDPGPGPHDSTPGRTRLRCCWGSPLGLSTAVRSRLRASRTWPRASLAPSP
jgi:hypothetical protein